MLGSTNDDTRTLSFPFNRKHRNVCLPTYISKNDSILCGGHLDVGFYVAEVVRSQQERLWLLHQLQVTCSKHGNTCHNSSSSVLVVERVR